MPWGMGNLGGAGETGGGGKAPEFTYTGQYRTEPKDLSTVTDGKWKIYFLTSGTLTINKLNSARKGVDIFAVGGGGAGTPSQSTRDEHGGGGGYTITKKAAKIIEKTSIEIVIGAGGTVLKHDSSQGNPGGSTTISALDIEAQGGEGASYSKGGNGGSGGGASDHIGGFDGNDGGGKKPAVRGIGQHTTTREFGEPSGKLYSGGGSGQGYTGTPAEGGGGKGGNNSGTGSTAGQNNSGGGGGNRANGGSGIVVMRGAVK